jgi:hypothetical protein
MSHVTDLGAGRVYAPNDRIQRLKAVDIERTGRAIAAKRGDVPRFRGNRLVGNADAL